MIISNLTSGKRLPISADVPKPLAELIARCWEQEPAKRPSMLEVVAALEKMQNNIDSASLPSTGAALSFRVVSFRF